VSVTKRKRSQEGSSTLKLTIRRLTCGLELNLAQRFDAGKANNGLPGANIMDDSRMERFMLKELLMIIAALVLVSAVLLAVVIFGNY